MRPCTTSPSSTHLPSSWHDERLWGRGGDLGGERLPKYGLWLSAEYDIAHQTNDSNDFQHYHYIRIPPESLILPDRAVSVRRNGRVCNTQDHPTGNKSPSPHRYDRRLHSLNRLTPHAHHSKAIPTPCHRKHEDLPHRRASAWTSALTVSA